MTSSSGLGRGVVTSTMGYLASPVAGFLSAPILAHVLGVAGRGEAGAAIAPLVLAMSMFTLGLPEALTYYVAKHPALARRSLGRAVAIVLGVGAAASVGIALLADFLADDDATLANLIRIAAIAVAPSLILTVIRGAAAGLQLWGLIAIERTVGSVSRLMAIGLLAAMGNLNTFTATVSIAVSGFVGVVVYVFLPRARRRLARADQGFEQPDRVRLLSFGLRMWLGSFAGILLSRIDQTLIVPLSSSYQLGLYVVAVSISELVLVFNGAVRDVMFAAESEHPDDERLGIGARASTFLTTISAAVVAIVGVWGVPWLFGSEFSQAIPVMEILLLGVVVGNPGSIAGAGLSARGRPELRSWSLVAAVVVNVGLLVLLVPAFGAMGAAWATTVGNLVAGGLNIVWLRVVFGMPLSTFLVPRVSDFVFIGKLARRQFQRFLPSRGSDIRND